MKVGPDLAETSAWQSSNQYNIHFKKSLALALAIYFAWAGLVYSFVPGNDATFTEAAPENVCKEGVWCDHEVYLGMIQSFKPCIVHLSFGSTSVYLGILILQLMILKSKNVTFRAPIIRAVLVIVVLYLAAEIASDRKVFPTVAGVFGARIPIIKWAHWMASSLVLSVMMTSLDVWDRKEAEKIWSFSGMQVASVMCGGLATLVRDPAMGMTLAVLRNVLYIPLLSLLMRVVRRFPGATDAAQERRYTTQRTLNKLRKVESGEISYRKSDLREKSERKSGNPLFDKSFQMADQMMRVLERLTVKDKGESMDIQEKNMNSRMMQLPRSNMIIAYRLTILYTVHTGVQLVIFNLGLAQKIPITLEQILYTFVDCIFRLLYINLLCFFDESEVFSDDYIMSNLTLIEKLSHENVKKYLEFISSQISDPVNSLSLALQSLHEDNGDMEEAAPLLMACAGCEEIEKVLSLMSHFHKRDVYDIELKRGLKPMDLKKLLQYLAARLQYLDKARQKKVIISLEISPDLPDIVVGDIEHMRHLISIIIECGIIFAKADSHVKVSANVVSESRSPSNSADNQSCSSNDSVQEPKSKGKNPLGKSSSSHASMDMDGEVGSDEIITDDDKSHSNKLGANYLTVALSVEGIGPGFREKKLNEIFKLRPLCERYDYDARTARNKYSSTGFTVVKQIIEMHAGSFFTETNDDGGALFGVMLDFRAPSLLEENFSLLNSTPIYNTIDQTMHNEKRKQMALAGNREVYFSRSEMEESVSDLSSPRLSENGEEEDVVWQPTVESASSPKRRKRSPRRATKRSQSPKKLHANGLSATEILLDERDDDGTAENTSLGYSHSTSKVGQARETGEVLTMTLTDLARSSRPLQNVVPQLSLGKNIMERCQIPGPEEPAERIERNAMEESAEENEFPDVTYSAEILDFEIKESSRSRSGSMTCRSYANSYSTQSYASSFTHKPHGLIVDGSKTSSKVTATLLARAGFTMELVSSGQACLDKLYPNSGIGSFFDVVFIESDLSDEMGKDIVRQLRDRSYPGMIIGLSQPSGVSELKASGCDEVVTKPVQLGVIMNLFEDKGLLSKGAHKEGDMSVASPQPIRRSHAVGRQ